MSPAILLALGILGGGLVWAAKSKAKEAPKPGEPGGAPASSQPGAKLKTVPAAVLAKITAALKSNSAKNMRKVADELEKAGYGAQAADLRRRASELEKAAAKTQEPPALSAEEVQGIVDTVATGNILAIRMLANGLRRRGYEAEAKELEAAADQLEQAQQEATKASSATAPAEPAPKVKVVAKTPGFAKTPTQFTPTSTTAIEEAAAKVVEAAAQAAPAVVAAATGPSASERALAGQVALALMNARKGSEDKALVARFQAQEGITNAAGINDGLYGRSTGVVLADKYDIVPPKPLYWGTKAGGWNSVVADKTAWRNTMMGHARTDAPRAEEWARAAAV